MKNNNRKPQYRQSKKTNKDYKLIFSKNNSIIIPTIIAFFIPVLLYLQTIHFDFSYFDDDGIIIKNINFLSHFRNVQQAFLTDAFIIKMSSFYRPMQTLSYIVDIQLSGGNEPWMYHLSNILLWGLIACSLFLLLKRLSIPTKLALLSTLIYCAHPLFVSSVAWLPARGDLQLTFFSLLSFLFFIEFLQKRKNIYLILNWITFTIALFCKETAVILPFIFIIYFFTFHSEKHFGKKHFFILLIYAISGISWYWLRSIAIGGYSNPNDVFGLTALLSNLPTIPESLTKFFLPVYSAPIPFYSIITTLTGLLIIAAIVFLFFKNNERSKKEKIFCVAWFLLFMLPPMLFKKPYIDYLDHRFSLPLIGILLFLLFIIPKKWFKNGDIKRSWLMVLILVIFCSFTFVKSRSYSDPMTFYNSAVSCNPNSVIANFNRGYIKNIKSDFQGSIDDFSKVIAICPSNADAYNNRGLAKLNMGDNSGAIADYTIAISKNNKCIEAYYNKGVAKGNIGDNIGAIEDFNKAVAICPTYYQAYYGRGNVKNSMGDFKGAVENFNKAIAICPTYAEAYNNRGLAKISMGDNSGAIADYDKAIAINPKFDLAYYNRGLAKAKTGDNSGAIADYNMSISFNNKCAEAYYNKGVANTSLGKFKEAIDDFDQAITIYPNYAEAYNKKGMATGSNGNLREAINNFNKAIEINPKYLEAYGNRAIAKINLKDFLGAIKDCEKILELNPHDRKAMQIKAEAQQLLQKTNH